MRKWCTFPWESISQPISGAITFWHLLTLTLVPFIISHHFPGNWLWQPKSGRTFAAIEWCIVPQWSDSHRHLVGDLKWLCRCAWLSPADYLSKRECSPMSWIRVPGGVPFSEWLCCVGQWGSLEPGALAAPDSWTIRRPFSAPPCDSPLDVSICRSVWQL